MVAGGVTQRVSPHTEKTKQERIGIQLSRTTGTCLESKQIKDGLEERKERWTEWINEWMCGLINRWLAEYINR